jgi:hypothetical protein
MRFCETFNINPFNCKIRSFEFGVNIKTNPSVFIDPIVMHKTKMPDINCFSGYGKMKQFVHREYSFRLYDKAAKEKIDEDLLRVEIKIKKMSKVKGIGISNLSDLLNHNKWQLLKGYLIKPINQMIFSEEITKELKGDDLIFYLQGKTHKFWLNLKAKDRQMLRNKRVKYQNLTIKYGCNYQGELINIINLKTNQLLETNQANLSDIELFLSQY